MSGLDLALVHELTDLLRWANGAPGARTDNATFWRRVWIAAGAYDVGTRTRVRCIVALFGSVPTAPATPEAAR